MIATRRTMGAYLAVFNDDNGRFDGLWTDFVQLTAKFYFNKGGMIVVVVPDGHSILEFCVRDKLFRLVGLLPEPFGWRKVIPDMEEPGIDLRNISRITIMHGLFRDKQISQDENGNIFHVLYFFHPMEILDRTISAWPKGVNNRTHWTGQRLSVIANDVLIWNCTADATVANGRIRDAAIIRGFEDMGAITGTPTVDFQIDPGTPVMDTIRDLSRDAPFNFSVGVSDFWIPAGLVSMQSPVTGGAVGRDLTDSIRFGLDLDNVGRISVGGDTLGEKTVAIVGGAGDGSSRTFEVRTGANYSTPGNDREVWVNASSARDDDLPAIGDLRLSRLQARAQINVSTLNTFGLIPFRHYTVGDIVTIFLPPDNTEIQSRIMSFEFTLDQSQKPQLSFEFEDV